MRNARKTSGKTLQQIADVFKITPQAVSQWELGDTEPSRETIIEFAKLTGVNLIWLLTGKKTFHNTEILGKNEITRAKDDAQDIPRYAMRIAGLVLRDRFSMREQEYDADGVYSTHYPCSISSVSFKIEDDANFPRYLKGDIVVIDPERRIFPGDMVLALKENSQHTIFRQLHVTKEEDGEWLEYQLVPINPSWPTEVVTDSSSFIIVGAESEHARPPRTSQAH